MTNRKILYGYQIQRGELVIQPQEAVTVRRVITLYMDGLSYQKIANTLNADGIPFSEEAPLWNKHKVKRLLENPRYTGDGGYPAIIDSSEFQSIQRRIRSKTEGYVKSEQRPALQLKEYLRCTCGGQLLRTAGRNRRKDTLYLKCGTCGKQFKILDSDLLSEVSKQTAEHDKPFKEGYLPSADTIRLANVINRGLERPEQPEGVVKLILQGVSARYDCCPAPMKSDTFNRLAKVDFKHFGQVTRAGLAISHITILDRMQALEKDENRQAMRASRQREMEEWLDRQELRFTEYEDSITRRFVEQITVVDADTIQVKIKDVDVVIDRKLC